MIIKNYNVSMILLLKYYNHSAIMGNCQTPCTRDDHDNFAVEVMRDENLGTDTTNVTQDFQYHHPAYGF